MFISVKVKKSLRKSQAQFREKLRKLRLRQDDGFRIKKKRVCIKMIFELPVRDDTYPRPSGYRSKVAISFPHHLYLPVLPPTTQLLHQRPNCCWVGSERDKDKAPGCLEPQVGTEERCLFW